jgi:hypothetical protein
MKTYEVDMTILAEVPDSYEEGDVVADIQFSLSKMKSFVDVCIECVYESNQNDCT